MRKISLLLLFLCTLVSHIKGQHLNDPTLNEDFARHVKSVEEFMNRFNGTEAYPGLDPKSSDFRQQNLYSLFDMEMSEQMKSKAMGFVSAVLDNSIILSFCDTTWYAVAECEVKYKGKVHQMTLVLQPQCEGQRRWWSFCGAKGILGGLLPKSSASTILPMEHETEFMELASIFNNDLPNIMGYCSSNHQPDQLTAFLALAQAGTIKFNHVTSLKLIFLQVPEYAFTVETVGRRGRNAGWLVTILSELPDEAKPIYINQLIGK